MRRGAGPQCLDEDAVQLAVLAHIRHMETAYDSLLARGYGRAEAREEVADKIMRMLSKWEGSE